jgi:cell division topological specificity factor
MDLFRLFDKKTPSKNIAKDRLKLVIIHDRFDCSPQVLEMLKSDIMKVISNYVEINEDEFDVQVLKSEQDSEIEGPRLYANIPIKNLRKKNKQ